MKDYSIKTEDLIKRGNVRIVTIDNINEGRGTRSLPPDSQFPAAIVEVAICVEGDPPDVYQVAVPLFDDKRSVDWENEPELFDGQSGTIPLFDNFEAYIDFLEEEGDLGDPEDEDFYDSQDDMPNIGGEVGDEAQQAVDNYFEHLNSMAGEENRDILDI